MVLEEISHLKKSMDAINVYCNQLTPRVETNKDPLIPIQLICRNPKNGNRLSWYGIEHNGWVLDNDRIFFPFTGWYEYMLNVFPSQPYNREIHVRVQKDGGCDGTIQVWIPLQNGKSQLPGHVYGSKNSSISFVLVSKPTLTQHNPFTINLIMHRL